MVMVAILGDSGSRHMQGVLQRAGHRILAVQGLAELAAAARETPVDVVLVEPSARVDVPVPELVRTITRDPQFQGMAVMPVLRRSDLADRVRSLWYGASNVVDLPLRDAELLASVASVAARRERRAGGAPGSGRVDFEYIDTAPALAGTCAGWQGAGVLAFDTEFERTVTYYPRPALMQALAADRLALLDLVALDDFTPLAAPLAEPSVTKLLHAGSEDMELLARLALPPPLPLFDTQVAAGFAGEGFSLGYAALVKQMLGIDMPKDQARSDWLQRPLSDAQLEYAAQDVVWLPALHERLERKLRELGRLDWVMEDCARIAAAAGEAPDAARAWERIRAGRSLSGRAHAVLRGLAGWREREARERNRPRNHVLHDSVLLEIAQRQPASRAALGGVQGLSARELSRSGEHLRAIVADAEETEDDAPTPLGTRVGGDVLKKLKAEVRRRAAELSLEPGLLAPNRMLEAVLASVAAGRRELPLRACVWLLLAALAPSPAAAEPLPEGFGGINVDMPWSTVETGYRTQLLDSPVTAWDGYVRDCGYRAVRIDADSGELRVQADDFTVTAVSFVSPIEPGSDLLAVADLVLDRYGEPERATQRDGLGRVTLDRAEVRYVTLEYEDPRPVEFSIAGAGVWEYRVEVRSAEARYHLNRMLRCARERERAAAQ